MKRSAKLGLGILVSLVGAQAIRCPHDNPPVTSDVGAPKEAAAVLRRACYDCHSNETVWPWYSHVAPVSWLVYHDVSDGRKHLNFSTWASYDDKKKLRKVNAAAEAAREGEMPPVIYLPAHPTAKLSDADRAALDAWAAATGK